MRLADIEQYWPMLEAARQGKTIQRFSNDKWWDCDPHNSSVRFGDDWSKYRIKPEPRLRPWTPQEVPVGAIVHDNAIGDWIACELITHKDSTGQVELGDGCGGKRWFSPQDLFNLYTHSTDGGKTWLPCGVAE